jgi:wyosine [tRNA(Phe)-imidazoG37] synthetase (radical SAM superfamily)
MSTRNPSILTFGPVPSRRLGRSLGINNIPPKSCSYSCLYCQVGPSLHKEVEPHEFYPPAEIFQAVKNRIAAVEAQGETIDYLTFVPDGEPTLDSQLGETIDLLRPLDIKIAVISNASLIWRADVQQRLNKADLVSLKVDTVDEGLWKKINRPHESLKHASILQGIRDFARQYKGELITETMLLAGINDSQAAVSGVADFLEAIQPSVAYVAIPTRPTAEVAISPPTEDKVVQAYTRLAEKLQHVETLIGYEGNQFAFSGDIEQDLLSITAVHPMREEAINAMLKKAGQDWNCIQVLLDSNKLKKVEFAGKSFFVRNFSGT